ncbi:MAG: Ycf66 family protein [Rhizonema sp. NSF051]|nr:Ycf66 family protein [Rhizonema sp. NSF051]
MLTFGLNSASVLAQVNFGANSASILGIVLAVAGAALYFLRTVRPELSRDQDIFFAAVGLLCGFILIFQGWRLDPILQFGQLLLAGTTVFFAVESIRLRGIATQQAKRNTPIVDDEREVSDRYQYNRKYQAEVDAELDPLPYDYEEERTPRARIPGSRDSRSSRDSYYDDETRSRSERRTSERPTSPNKTRRRSSGGSTNRNPERQEDENLGSSRYSDDWDSSTTQERRSSDDRDSSTTQERRSSDDRDSSITDERRSSTRRSGTKGSIRPESRDEDVAPRQRRRRPPTDSTSGREREDDVMPSEYVEYKPIDARDHDPDNPVNFEE